MSSGFIATVRVGITVTPLRCAQLVGLCPKVQRRWQSENTGLVLLQRAVHMETRHNEKNACLEHGWNHVLPDGTDTDDDRTVIVDGLFHGIYTGLRGNNSSDCI